MGLVVYLLVNGFAIFIAAQVLGGVHVDSFMTAVMVAVILGIVNVLIKPFITLLTLPLTIITLGLFSLVINALLILLVDRIVPGFSVDGFWWALLFSLVISIISSFLSTFVKK